MIEWYNGVPPTARAHREERLAHLVEPGQATPVRRVPPRLHPLADALGDRASARIPASARQLVRRGDAARVPRSLGRSPPRRARRAAGRGRILDRAEPPARVDRLQVRRDHELRRGDQAQPLGGGRSGDPAGHLRRPDPAGVGGPALRRSGEGRRADLPDVVSRRPRAAAELGEGERGGVHRGRRPGRSRRSSRSIRTARSTAPTSARPSPTRTSGACSRTSSASTSEA